MSFVFMPVHPLSLSAVCLQHTPQNKLSSACRCNIHTPAPPPPANHDVDININHFADTDEDAFGGQEMRSNNDEWDNDNQSMDTSDDEPDDYGSNNMDIDNNEDDGLEDLPPFEEESGAPELLANLDEVDQDEFLRDLVTLQIDEVEETTLPTSHIDYRQFNPHNLLSLDAFGLFGDNIKSKIYYWQNNVHHRLSKGKVLLGGIMSIMHGVPLMVIFVSVSRM